MSTHAPRPGRRTASGEPHKRRPNACEPCRNSKSKCDGGNPCTQCTKKRVKPQCIYRSQTSGARTEQDDVDGMLQTISENIFHSDTTDPADWDRTYSTIFETESTGVLPRGAVYAPAVLAAEVDPFGANSLARCIDHFKLLPVAEDQKPYCEAIDRCHGDEVFNKPEAAMVMSQHGDVQRELETMQQSIYCSASQEMPADERIPAFLIGLHQEAMSIHQLIDRGQVVLAWLDLPRLMRLAQMNGLATNQEPPSTHHWETEFRRRIWWLILGLDVQVSLHMGQPLAIKSVDTVASPSFSGLPPHQRELEQSKLDFRQYMLDVLDNLFIATQDKSGSVDFEVLLQKSELPRLERLRKKLPLISQRADSDIGVTVAVADHRLEVHVFKLLLCCRLARAKFVQVQDISVRSRGDDPKKDRSRISSPVTPRSNRLRSSQRHRSYEYQKEILDCTRGVLNMFEIIYDLERSDTGLLWPRCFGAFCAASILAIARLRRETEDDIDLQMVQRAWEIFKALSERHPQCNLFRISTQRLGDLVREIYKLQTETHGSLTEDALNSSSDPYDNNESVLTRQVGPGLQRSPSASEIITPRPKRYRRTVGSADGSPHKRQRGLQADGADHANLVDTALHWPMFEEMFEANGTVSSSMASDISVASSFASSSYTEPFVTSNNSYHEADPPFWHPPMWPPPPDMSGFQMSAGFHPPLLPYHQWSTAAYQETVSSVEPIGPESAIAIASLPPSQSSAVYSGDVTPEHLMSVEVAGAGYCEPAVRTIPVSQRSNGSSTEQGQALQFHNETTESIRKPANSSLALSKKRGSRTESVCNVRSSASRRRSVADVKNHANAAWNIETPSKYEEGKAIGNSRFNKEDHHGIGQCHSDGSRTPDKVDGSVEHRAPLKQIDCRARSIVVPVPHTTLDAAASMHQPHLEAHRSQLASSKSHAQLPSRQVIGFRQDGAHVADIHNTSHFHQPDHNTWLDLEPHIHFNSLHEVPQYSAFDIEEEDDLLQSLQTQPILATGPYERQQYSTSWYH